MGLLDGEGGNFVAEIILARDGEAGRRADFQLVMENDLMRQRIINAVSILLLPELLHRLAR